MWKRVLFVASFFWAFLVLAGVSQAAELVVVWGSTTCQKRFLEPSAPVLSSAKGIKLNVVGVGTGKGLIGLLDGKADASAASESLEDAIVSARKVASEDSRDLNIPDNLVYHEILADYIIPIVHEDNPVTELSWQQLSDIHTGKIKNWSEVGGGNLPIQVVTSHTGSATRAVFRKLVMKKQDYVSDAIQVDSTRKEILAVSGNKGSIGAVSAGFLEMFSGKTKAVRTPKISRPLGLITIGAPKPKVQKVIDFVRTEEARKHFE